MQKLEADRSRRVPNRDMDPQPAMESDPTPEGRPHPSAPVADGIPALLADLASKVLATKEGETFLYSDNEGNLDDRTELGLGLYHRDTRFLSHYRMKLSDREPVLLSSSAERASMSYVDLTNQELYDDGEPAVPQQTLNIRRVRAINGRVFERVRIKNYNGHAVSLRLSFSLAADFADIFEVRGFIRGSAGHHRPPTAEGRRVEVAYDGADKVKRRTVISCGPQPDR